MRRCKEETLSLVAAQLSKASINACNMTSYTAPQTNEIGDELSV
jgi:hypothetical protein